MNFTINAFNHAEWQRHGLADFEDFADQITECNMGEDSFSGFGEWYFIPEEPLPNGERVIYYGSWGNDNSPGASSYTYAELFDVTDPDELAVFALRVEFMEGQPEYHQRLEESDI